MARLLALANASATTLQTRTLPVIRHREEVRPWHRDASIQRTQVLDNNPLCASEADDYDLISDLRLDVVVILQIAAGFGLHDQNGAFLLACKCGWIGDDNG